MAINNTCGICVGGATGLPLTEGMDACGECAGDNSTCTDCEGVVNGYVTVFFFSCNNNNNYYYYYYYYYIISVCVCVCVCVCVAVYFVFPVILCMFRVINQMELFYWNCQIFSVYTREHIFKNSHRTCKELLPNIYICP